MKREILVSDNPSRPDYPGGVIIGMAWALAIEIGAVVVAITLYRCAAYLWRLL